MIPRTTRYAVAAATALAERPDEMVTRRDLARRTGVPADYLAKVLQALAHGGLVLTQRGVGGGYRLARPPNQITVVEVLLAVQPAEPGEGLPETQLDATMALLWRAWEGLSLADLAAGAAGATEH